MQADAALLADLRAIYAEADRATAAAGAACMGGGACCRFDLIDHRLYVSLAELALLTTEPPGDFDRADRLRCPYQSGPDCTAYDRRPLGCRIFSCGAVGNPTPTELYERLHVKVRALHQTRCRPYVYAELTSSLLQLHSCE